MSTRNILGIIIGVVLLSLGLLWFLQGSNVIHLNPILCVTNCQPITGYSPLWQIIGAITSIAGIGIIWINIKNAIKPTQHK